MPLDGATFLSNPKRVALETMSQVMAPPPPMDYADWAEKNIVFGDESPFPGRYRAELFPFFARIFEVLSPEHPAREVVIAKSAQIGGTVLAQIFSLASLDRDPGPMLYVHPTEQNAARWAKQKWRPMVRQVLPNIFPSATSRDGANSILYQERRDGRGFIQIGGANSEAALSMISVSRQIQDDLAKWEDNSAGDPEAQADSRSKAFEDAKILKISTPLVWPGCRITRAYKASTREKFHVPCPHCAHVHALEWDNFHIKGDDPETACFDCPDCGCEIHQNHRNEMLRNGNWIAENPGARTVGFHIWAAYSRLESWARIAANWLKAKGDPASEQTFFNDTLGIAYETQGEAPPWEDLKKRADASELLRSRVPVGALLITMGLDCQGDRVEWHLRGFGQNLRSWTIEHGVVPGHISEKDTRHELDQLMGKRWQDLFGNTRPLDIAAIDAGAYTDDVLDWAKRHPISKVIMVRGSGSDLAPTLALVPSGERRRNGRIKRYGKRFYTVGVSGLKMSLYDRLAKTDPLERGYIGLPEGLDADFFQQLTAERREKHRKKDGTERWLWTKEPAQANEMLDTAIYAEAAAIRIGWRQKNDDEWSILQDELERPAEAAQGDFEDLFSQARPAATVLGALPATRKTGTVIQTKPVQTDSWVERLHRHNSET